MRTRLIIYVLDAADDPAAAFATVHSEIAAFDPMLAERLALVALNKIDLLDAAMGDVLLDREMDAPVVSRIRSAIECDGDAEIADLHVWRVGRGSHAAVITVVAGQPLTPAAYRGRLACIETLVHVSVEVNRCPHGDCPS